MLFLFRVAAWSMIVIVLNACGRPPAPPVPEFEPELPTVTHEDADLMAQWREIPKAGHKHMDIQQALSITGAMARSGPEGLTPLFDVLAGADEDPVSKMLAVICLTPHFNESWLPRLTPLMTPENDPVTRGCAIHLASTYHSDEAFRQIKKYLTDDNTHVQKVAMLTLLRYGDLDALKETIAYWKGPDISSHDRNEIILAFPDAQAAEHLWLFEEAACGEGLDSPARKRAIQLLGALSDMDVLEELTTCLEKETDDELRGLLRFAIDAIRGRAKSLSENQTRAGRDQQDIS